MSGQGCQCGQAHGACATEFQYAVKIVCGEMKPADNTPVAPGRYWTATNIHNPDKCRTAHFRLKVGVALQSLESPVSQYLGPIPLGPDGMLEIDCSLIQFLVAYVLYPPPKTAPSFVKGYLVLESDVELDVVAVYTGSTGPCAANTFHTERVPARCVPVCEDLIMPLHTGIAQWQTIASTAGGALGPAVLVNPLHSGWAAPPAGSQWISQFASDGINATTTPTTKQYELCFDLCAGVTTGQFQVHAIADDTIQVYVNNNWIGTNNTYNTIAPFTVQPGMLHAGHNCFRVVVSNNVPQATGFALAGMLNVPRGKCPCPVPEPRRTPGATSFAAETDPATAALMARLGQKETAT